MSDLSRQYEMRHHAYDVICSARPSSPHIGLSAATRSGHVPQNSPLVELESLLVGDLRIDVSPQRPLAQTRLLPAQRRSRRALLHATLLLHCHISDYSRPLTILGGRTVGLELGSAVFVQGAVTESEHVEAWMGGQAASRRCERRGVLGRKRRTHTRRGKFCPCPITTA